MPPICSKKLRVYWFHSVETNVLKAGYITHQNRLHLLTSELLAFLTPGAVEQTQQRRKVGLPSAGGEQVEGRLPFLQGR